MWEKGWLVLALWWVGIHRCSRHQASIYCSLGETGGKWIAIVGINSTTQPLMAHHLMWSGKINCRMKSKYQINAFRVMAKMYWLCKYEAYQKCSVTGKRYENNKCLKMKKKSKLELTYFLFHFKLWITRVESSVFDGSSTAPYDIFCLKKKANKNTYHFFPFAQSNFWL